MWFTVSLNGRNIWKARNVAGRSLFKGSFHCHIWNADSYESPIFQWLQEGSSKADKLVYIQGFLGKTYPTKWTIGVSEMNISQEICVRINWIAINSELIYWKKKLRN